MKSSIQQLDGYISAVYQEILENIVDRKEDGLHTRDGQDSQILDEGSRSCSPLSADIHTQSDYASIDADIPYSIGTNESHPYSCQFCQKAFTRLSHLKKHEQVHSDLLPFKCNYCNRLFRHKRSRDRHVKLHTGDKKHKCTKCDSAFARSDHLKIHLKSHDNGKPFRCTICSRGYTNSAALTSHMLFHKKYPSSSTSPSKRFKCTQFISETTQIETTSLIDTSINPLINYDKTQAYAELICEFCLKSGFSNKDVLDMHIQMVHAGKSKAPYLCPFCNAAYPTFYNLAEHVKILHEPLFSSKHPFQCDFCNKEFKSAEEMKHHKDKYHKLSSSTSSSVSSSAITCFCPACNISFTNQNTLADHVTLVHQNHTFQQRSPERKRSAEHLNSNNSPPQQLLKIPKIHVSPQLPEPTTQNNDELEIINCDQCGMKFYDQKLFKDHLRSHFTTSPVIAVPCESSSSATVTITTSPVTSTNNPTCPECRTDFTSQEDLETHLITHYLSSTTEYGCTSCLKLFSKPDELQKHLMDIHAHHLYRCSLCKEIFDSKVNVQVHFAIKHSNECKLYKCTLCSTIFRSEMEWQLHVKVQHLHISKPYRCLFCKDSFSTEMELQVHLTAHKKQYQCPLCSEAFHVEYQLDKHMHSKHSQDTNHDFKHQTSFESDIGNNRSHISPPRDREDDKFNCTVCDAKFADETTMLTHLSQSHSVLEINNSSVTVHSPTHSETTKSLDLTLPDKFSNACVYCNQTFKTKGELEKHMKVHATPSSLKCNICDEVFPSSNILAEHKLIHCKVVQGNVCVICKFTLKNESQFYFHSEQHGLQGTNMQCVICRQTLMSSVELNMHAKFHFQNSHSFFTCCVCLKTFSTKENLVAKLNSSGRAYYVCKPCYHGHDEEYQCTQCNKSFGTKTELDVHIKIHKKTYQCIKCQEAFNTEYEIQMHVATHMIQEGNVHECHICDQIFESPAKLQCHLIEHTFEGLKEFRCYVCHTVFTQPTAIQSHVLEHGISARKYSCIQCNQRFFFSAELQNHLFIHGIKVERGAAGSAAEIQCPDCEKVFPNVTELNVHHKTHNDKRIKCPMCPQSYIGILDLQQHFMKNHGDAAVMEKCYLQCPVCDKETNSFSSLYSHMKVHGTGKENRNSPMKFPINKQFNCSVCLKSFVKKSQMKEHMSSHFNQQFRCDVCDETFPQLRLLNHHHCTIHKDNDKIIGENNNSPSIGNESMSDGDQQAEINNRTNSDLQCPEQLNETFRIKTELIEYNEHLVQAAS
ncbi:uncharacterized protein LOC141902269 [Tubulanus polymorphus]|uniref:uncharacterized protein LOC141902269 n=1 Tax=Tubulanus polymorphus TaxID=672921 RepID=UPI003DA33385